MSPHVIRPWPASTTPRMFGLASTTSRSRRPRSNPGRCHGSHPSSPPKTSRVSASLWRDAAIAMTESGWTWSTCANGKQRMQRSVDAGGARAAGKRAILEVWNDLIFVLAPAKAAFQRDEFVLIELREAGQIHRAQIVAGSFHPQNGHARVGQRIDVREFCRGVAAAEICHAEIGAQQMRAIQKQLGLRQAPFASASFHRSLVTRGS